MRKFALFLCLGLFILLPIHAQAQEQGPIYIVKEGDSLYSIADRFGTTVEALVAVNPIANPSLIQPGTELMIPGYEGVTGVLETREISFGENLSSLSLRYDLSQEELIQLNRIVHPGRIYIGQAIIHTLSGEDSLGMHGELGLLQAGSGVLAYAAQRGLTPWKLLRMDAEPISTWEVPGERLILPGDEELLDSMPEPLRSVDVRPARVLQGRTLTVQVASEDPIRIDGVVGEQALRFVKATDETLVALEGIHAMLEPGLYDLQLNFYEDGDGDPFFSHSQPLRVASGQYGYDPILIVPEETLDPSVTGPENEFIASIVAEVDENRYWEGFFQFPGQYVEAFPSHFGARRNYNNTGYNNYHTGLDFYGGAGSLIYAPASGRVAFAGDLEVRGKVTLIDHGWGVYTGYLHQSEILVREGDRVQVGEVIGKVGGTGRVTGPHLHWEVWVGGQPVDPLEWTSVELP